MNDHLPADLISFLKSGKITVRQDGKKLVEVSANDGNVTVNVENLLTGITTASRAIAKISEARILAGMLSERGVTLTLAVNDESVVRLGRGAKPKLSRILTRSGDVEVTNLRELRRLDRRLRAGEAGQH